MRDQRCVRGVAQSENVKVLVRMIQTLKVGALITVHYGDETSFKYAWDKYWVEAEAVDD